MPLARHAPMPRHRKPLARKTPLRGRNSERRGRLYKVQFGDRAEWLRRQACATCTAAPRSDPSHTQSRGAGGRKHQQIPQCRRCHRLLHDIGKEAFEARFGVDLDALAAAFDALWLVSRSMLMPVLYPDREQR